GSRTAGKRRQAPYLQGDCVNPGNNVALVAGSTAKLKLHLRDRGAGLHTVAQYAAIPRCAALGDHGRINSQSQGGRCSGVALVPTMTSAGPPSFWTLALLL